MKEQIDQRKSSALANSDSPAEIKDGFEMITAIVSGKKDAGRIDFGFIDNALFLARKRASHEDAGIRDAVIELLVSISEMGTQWREAVIETAEEICAQPSDNARSVAARVRKTLKVSG